MAAANRRLQGSGRKVTDTGRGRIETIDCGQGLPVLWVHGIVGGADQGPGMAQAYFGEGFRVIAVSRFGYLGSPLPPDASPAAQADLYASLLDVLGIQKIALVGTSAGTSSSLQFALRYPERCAALVLWSMAVPPYSVPSQPARSALQAFFGSDFLLWATMTYRPALMLRIMGVPAAIQDRLTPAEQEQLKVFMHSFLPVSQRIKGIMNDVCVSNPGMNDLSILERVTVPTFIIHAVDDPMPPFAGAKQISGQLPNARFIEIGDGGHLLLGHLDQVRAEMAAFIRQHANEPHLAAALDIR